MSSGNVNIDRELELVFDNLCRSIWKGCKKLKNKANLAVFFLVVLITSFSVVNKDELPDSLPLKIFLYLLPLIYLGMLGVIKSTSEKEREAQSDLFISNGFVSKDGKPPAFIAEKAVSDTISELTYTAMIPLAEWQNKKETIEQVLDRSVLSISQGKSKRTFILKCLPSGYKFPEFLPWKDDLISKKSGVVRIGDDSFGRLEFDLNKLPHIIVAGETGSGKSVLMRCILWQLLNQGAKAYMMDFKSGVEFGIEYEQFGEVVTDQARALEVLTLLEEENKKRLELFRECKVKNLNEYNERYNENLSRIVLVIDEVAEMLDKKGALSGDKKIIEQIEGKMSTLARLARAAGIHMMLGIQRPDANILTGQIKNNIPIRICGRFADNAASQIVLGNTEATRLPDIKGRFMYKLGADTKMFQAYLFDDSMLREIDIQPGKILCDFMVRKKKKATTA